MTCYRKQREEEIQPVVFETSSMQCSASSTPSEFDPQQTDKRILEISLPRVPNAHHNCLFKCWEKIKLVRVPRNARTQALIRTRVIIP